MSAPALPFALLAAAAFLSALAARVIDPLLAVLAEEFHSSIAPVSLVIAAFTLPYGATQLVIGPLADRFGKLQTMTCIVLAFAAAMAACALAADLGQLIALRVLTGMAAAGLVPLSLAMVGDSLPYEQRQVAMSRITAGFTLGQVMAGPVGGVFGDTLGWRGVFVVIGALALLVFGLLVRRLAVRPGLAGSGGGTEGGYRALAANPQARLLLAITLVEGALFAGTFPFLAPFLRQQWSLSYSMVGLVLAFFGLGGLVYAALARRMVPALGETRLVLLGGSVLVLALSGMLSVPGWQIFPLFQAMLGFGYFTAHGVLQARATELLPQARATAVSVFALTLFLGQSIGALGLGNASAAFGFPAALAAATLGILLLTFWLAWIVRRPAGVAQEA